MNIFASIAKESIEFADNKVYQVNASFMSVDSNFLSITIMILSSSILFLLMLLYKLICAPAG